MRKYTYIWLLLVIIVLLVNIFGYALDPAGDATGNVMFYLGVLGFPMSVLPTVAAISIIGYSVPDASNPIVFAGICISYVAAGIVQWFWLFPAIIKFRRKSSHKQ